MYGKSIHKLCGIRGRRKKKKNHEMFKLFGSQSILSNSKPVELGIALGFVGKSEKSKAFAPKSVKTLDFNAKPLNLVVKFQVRRVLSSIGAVSLEKRPASRRPLQRHAFEVFTSGSSMAPPGSSVSQLLGSQTHFQMHRQKLPSILKQPHK